LMRLGDDSKSDVAKVQNHRSTPQLSL